MKIVKWRAGLCASSLRSSSEKDIVAWYIRLGLRFAHIPSFAWTLVLLKPHKFRRLGFIRWVQEFGHDQGEFFECDRFRDVRVEACVYALGVYVAQHVGRESDNGVSLVSVFLFPSADLFAGLVAVFVRHMKIALPKVLVKG